MPASRAISRLLIVGEIDIIQVYLCLKSIAYAPSHCWSFIWTCKVLVFANVERLCRIARASSA